MGAYKVCATVHPLFSEPVQLMNLTAMPYLPTGSSYPPSHPVSMLPLRTAKETDTMKIQWFGCLSTFYIPWRQKDYLLLAIMKFNPLYYIAYDQALL